MGDQQDGERGRGFLALALMLVVVALVLATGTDRESMLLACGLASVAAGLCDLVWLAIKGNGHDEPRSLRLGKALNSCGSVVFGVGITLMETWAGVAVMALSLVITIASALVRTPLFDNRAGVAERLQRHLRQR
jgi:hypothetical protein